MKNKKNRPGKQVDISGINSQELICWIRQNKERWHGIKCQALIALCNGASVTEVCKVLNVTRESVRLWRISLQKGGLQGLVVSNKKGKRSALTEKIKKDLYEILNTEPQKLGYDYNKWTGKLICRYLKENWNIDIAIRTAQNWKKLIQNQ